MIRDTITYFRIAEIVVNTLVNLIATKRETDLAKTHAEIYLNSTSLSSERRFLRELEQKILQREKTLEDLYNKVSLYTSLLIALDYTVEDGIVTKNLTGSIDDPIDYEVPQWDELGEDGGGV